MIRRIVTSASLTLALAGAVVAAEALKSGPQVGEDLPGTFKPLNITGPDAGKVTCIFCEYGESPVALVFARTLSEPLARLTKRLDAAAGQHKAAGLFTSVVFLNRDESLPKEIKQLAEREKIEHASLRTFKPEGPMDYNIAKDADITVILFTDRAVKANHVFRKGELTDKAIDVIVAEIPKILPAKK
jgi:hypothetical protein